MRSTHQQISIGVDFIANLDRFTQGINSAKGIMSKLDISEQTRKGIDGLAEKMSTEITKIKDIASRGKVDIVDVNKINTSIKHIESAYAQMISKIEDMGGDSTFLKNDAKALKALKNGQDEYKEAIKETEKEQKKFNDALEKAKKAQKEGGKESKKKVVSNSKYEELEAKRIAAKAQKKTAERKQIAASKKVEEKITESNGKYTSRDSKGFKNTAAYQEEKKAIEEVRRAELQLQKIQKELGEATTLDKQAEEAKELAANVDKAEKELKDFLNTQKQSVSTDAFEKVKKSLLEMKDINWGDAGIDPSQINNIEQLEQAMKKLGTESAARLVAELPKLKTEMESSGDAIQKARTETDQMTSSAQNLDAKMSQLDSMKQRITYFFGLQNAAMLARRAFTSVFNTIKELDAVMTEMAVVTDFSIGDWWKQLPEYTERANEFGLAIKDVYEADTLFYQQGLKRNEVMALSNETMKMARIAGLETADATDRMTNALRGFNMELNQTNAQNVADVYSELAAISASNVDELSVAMTKTASIASNAGASFENTAAFIAQIVETTRESAETAGTALKTVIARFTELKKDPSEIGEVDGEVVDANKIETALRSVGVALRDSNGEFRDFDDVILELSSKWDSLDVNTQRYIATIAAGSRQQSRFIALMSNNARLTQLTAAANSAAGASQKQYDKTLESLETKLNRLKNAANEFLTTIGNSDIIKGAIDALTLLINLLNKITSWGPRWIQMFTKTAAAIGLFAGLKKVAQSSLAKIGATMGLQGAQAGTSYTQALNKTMNKGVLNAFARAEAKIRNFSFKEAFAGFWKGAKIDSEVLNSDLSEILNNRKNLSKEEFDNQVFEAGKKSGMTDQHAINLVRSFEKVEKSAEELALAHEDLVAKKREEIAATETVNKTQYEEAMANQSAEKTEWGEVLANKESFTAEQMEALQSSELFTSKELEILANKNSFTSKRAELLASKGIITEKEKEAVVTAASTTAEGAETAANDAATASEVAETKANINSAISESTGGTNRSGGVQGKITTLFSKIGSFLKTWGALIASIAIIITSIVGVIKLVDNSMTTLEERADSVAKALSKVTEKLGEVNSAISSFAQTKDGIIELTKNIQNLAQGSNEWSNVALELSGQVQDIVAEYPELRKYIATVNGINTLTQAGLEKYNELLLEQQKTLSSLETTLTIQQEEMKLITNTSQISGLDSRGDLEESKKTAAGWSTGVAGTAGLAIGVGTAMATGASLGAAIGGWAGPIGAIIGVTAGAVIGEIIGVVLEKQQEKEQHRSEGIEKAIQAAYEQGFVATNASAQEISKFVHGLELDNAQKDAVYDEIIKNNGNIFDTWVANQGSIEQQYLKLGQEQASQADLLGGQAERYAKIFADKAKESLSQITSKKVQEKIKETGIDYEEEEFEYRESMKDYYMMYEQITGTQLDWSNTKKLFGEDSDINNAQVLETIAAYEAKQVVNGEAELKAIQEEARIRNDENSSYNKVLQKLQLDTTKNDWAYSMTEDQLKAIQKAIEQTEERGGNVGSLGDYISEIMRQASIQGIESNSVLSYIGTANLETQQGLRELENNLAKLGLVLESNFTEEIIAATKAVDRIDLSKLETGLSKIVNAFDAISETANKVITSEQKAELLNSGQYDESDFGELANGDWVIKSLDKFYTAQDIFEESAKNSLSEVIANITKEQELVDTVNTQKTDTKILNKKDVEKYSREVFGELISNIIPIAEDEIDKVAKKDAKYYNFGNHGYKLGILDALINGSYEDHTQLYKALGKGMESIGYDPSDGVDPYGNLRNLERLEAIANSKTAGYVPLEGLAVLTAYVRKNAGDITKTGGLVPEEMTADYVTENWGVAQKVAQRALEEALYAAYKSDNLIMHGYLSYDINHGRPISEESLLLEDYLEKAKNSGEISYDTLQLTLAELWKKYQNQEEISNKTIYDALVDVLGKEVVGKWNEDNQTDYIIMLENYVKKEVVIDKGQLEKGLLGANDTQMALNQAERGQDSLFNKNINTSVFEQTSEVGIDVLETWFEAVEGGEWQFLKFKKTMDSTTNSIKAMTIEYDKNRKKIDLLLQDLSDYKDVLSNSSDSKFMAALSEISKSVYSAGLAVNATDAQRLVKNNFDLIKQMSEGGEIGQQAYEAFAKKAREIYTTTKNISPELIDIANEIDGMNLEVGVTQNITTLLGDNKSEEDWNTLKELLEIGGFTVTIGVDKNTGESVFEIVQNNFQGTGKVDLDEKSLWENTFDRLYNLNVDINAELRERNRLERAYQRMLKDTENLTAQKVKKNVEARGNSLVDSIAQEKAKIEGRKWQIDELVRNNSEFADFVYYDEQTKEPKINWDLFNAKTGVWDQDKGDKAREFVDQWKEWVDENFESEEKIEEYTDELKELESTGEKEYMELQQKVYDAILKREEELIDGMERISDSIDQASSDMLQGLQKSIQKLRQDRQNQETEQDIADKEQQLVYLSSSTTGDSLEIMRLEEEIADARQSYTDRLIDQKISELEDQNEQAKTQREKQIAIAQAQLEYNKENGVYWEQVNTVMQNGIKLDGKIKDDSQLANLLKNNSGFNALSKEDQTKLWDDLNNSAVLAKAYTDKFTFQSITDAITTWKDNNTSALRTLEGLINGSNGGGNGNTDLSEFDDPGSDSGTIYQKSGGSDTARAYTQNSDGTWSRGGMDTDMSIANGKFEYIDKKENQLIKSANGTTSSKTMYQIKDSSGGYRWVVGDSFTETYSQSSLKQSSDQKQQQENNKKQYFNEAIAALQEFSSGGAKNKDNNQAFKEAYKKYVNAGGTDDEIREYLKKNPITTGTFPGAKVSGLGVYVGNDDTIDITLQGGSTFSADIFHSNKATNEIAGQIDKLYNNANMTPGNAWLVMYEGTPYVRYNGSWIPVNNADVTTNLKNSLNQFKTGGLADFTGPAWLDGTKSAPEIVLNAQDTKNFLQLRDILSDLFKGGNFERSGSSGDNYYDIDINVDEISNDYDVDQLAARIKQQIVSDASYRNVNAINFMR